MLSEVGGRFDLDQGNLEGIAQFVGEIGDDSWTTLSLENGKPDHSGQIHLQLVSLHKL